jgi:hypothetical protein
MEIDVCPKCKGTGRIHGPDGLHTCFDCLTSGKLDTYNKEIKSSQLEFKSKPIVKPAIKPEEKPVIKKDFDFSYY